MGQKIHPLGFRLGINQDYKSKWYANFNQYSNFLKEDYKIRSYFMILAKFYNITNIKITRNTLYNQIQVYIEIEKSTILLTQINSEIQKIKLKIKKFLSKNYQLNIKLIELTKTDLNASLLANLIKKQLENRIAFRRVMRDAIQKAQKYKINGIKIQLSGRLNGAEIARTEWIREGKIPLQTIQANIDYRSQEAHTIYGVLGIKVWLFKNKIILN